MKTKSWVLAVFYSALLWLIAFSLASCNPVKRVMKDPAKVHQVFTQALRSGIESCVTDTFTVHKSDTLVTTDTSCVFEHTTDTVNNVQKEVVTKYVNKYYTIRDTVLKTIKDVTTEQILRGDVLALREKCDTETMANNEAKKERDKWKLRFFILLFISVAWFTRKLWFPLLTKIRI